MRKTFIALLACSSVPLAGATTVFTDNFESGPLGSAWSGGGAIESTQGLSAYGFGLQHLRNDGTGATTLSLSGLAAHTEVTLSFDLAMWDSIDLGDSFRIEGGGVPLFFSGPANPAFGNYFPPEPGPGFGPGVQITPDFNGFSTPNLGYNGGFRDSARSVSFSFLHSGPTMDISWHYLSSQGGLDESFGLDNVSVSINAIPEPSSWLLMALGLGGVGSVAARRRG